MAWVRSAAEELTPIIVFGVTNYFYSFETAVLAMVGALVFIAVVTTISGRALPWFAIISTAALSLFVGVSILFDDFSIFTASDTILDGILGIVLLWSLRWKQPLIQTLFERTFAITDEAWRILTWRWGILFVVLALLNEIVRLNVSNEVWAYFKIGVTIFIVLFGCYQFTLSARMRHPEESNWLGLRTKSSRSD